MVTSRAIVLLVLISCQLTFAATPSCSRTIEENCALADLVVIGQVVSGPTLIPNNSGSLAPGPPGFSAIPVSPACVPAKLRIQQTLKGSAFGDITFYTCLYDPEPFWCSGRRSLFFLYRGSSYTRMGQGPVYANVSSSPSKFPWVLSDWDDQRPIDLTIPASRGVLSSDLQNGLSPDHIIKIVSAHCADTPTTPVESIESRLGYEDGHWPCLLLVPLDEPIYSQARCWAKSPSPSNYWNASRILSNHRSEENVAGLCEIASCHPSTREAYFGRELAIDQLERWGISTPHHFLGQESVEPVVEFGIVLLIAFLIAFVSMRFRLTFLGIGILGTSLLFGVIVFLALLWVGSYFDGVGIAGGHAELGIWQGDFAIIRRTNAAISRSQPIQLCGLNDLQAIQGFKLNHFYSRRFPGEFGYADIDGGAGEFASWDDVHGFSLPAWIPPLLVSVIVLSWRALAGIRRRVDKRRRGFPVTAFKTKQAES